MINCVAVINRVAVIVRVALINRVADTDDRGDLSSVCRRAAEVGREGRGGEGREEGTDGPTGGGRERAT